MHLQETFQVREIRVVREIRDINFKLAYNRTVSGEPVLQG
jgi:hypothetical protein